MLQNPSHHPPTTPSHPLSPLSTHRLSTPRFCHPQHRHSITPQQLSTPPIHTRNCNSLSRMLPEWISCRSTAGMYHRKMGILGAGIWGWDSVGKVWIMISVRVGMWICLMGSFLEGQGIFEVGKEGSWVHTWLVWKSKGAKSLVMTFYIENDI